MDTERVLTLKKQVTDFFSSRETQQLPPEFFREISALPEDEAMELAAQLFMMEEWWNIWTAVLIFEKHAGARRKINWKYLEPLGNRMDSWGLVDAFAYLAGPAWRNRQLTDTRVIRWTRSKNRWWRRAALVCTVFLNRKTQGGTGDTPRTLMVCEALVSDRDDMVVKGMSWALRDLLKRDRQAVEKFLAEHESELAARVKREVRNKLTTGVKNPRRKMK